MRTRIVASMVLLLSADASFAQENKSKVNLEKAYEAILKSRPDIRNKVESGQATKEDIINWLKKKGFGKDGGKTAKKPRSLNVEAFNRKLGELTKAGKLSAKEAEELKDILQDKKASKKETPINLEKLGEQLKAAVQSGKMTRKEAIQKFQAAAQKLGKGQGGKARAAKVSKGKGKGGKGSGFYAIVIGRLKSKDIELGEFTLDVDYVTSMYSNRWVKDKIVGKTVKVTGVSGQFRDHLLLIKRGQTLKFRSGTYDEATNTLTFGFKFHVLERAEPFDPEAYGVPHDDFRGFVGTLEGKIMEHGGYELLMQVEKVSASSGNKARNAQAAKGKLVRMNGFFRVQKKYDDLTKGDRIRVSVRHADPKFDEFAFASDLAKVK